MVTLRLDAFHCLLCERQLFIPWNVSRYRAIVKPLDIQTSRTTGSIVLQAALIWLLALVLAVPEATLILQLFFLAFDCQIFTLMSLQRPGREKSLCYFLERHKHIQTQCIHTHTQTHRQQWCLVMTSISFKLLNNSYGIRNSLAKCTR